MPVIRHAPTTSLRSIAAAQAQQAGQQRGLALQYRQMTIEAEQRKRAQRQRFFEQLKAQKAQKKAEDTGTPWGGIGGAAGAALAILAAIPTGGASLAALPGMLAAGAAGGAAGGYIGGAFEKQPNMAVGQGFGRASQVLDQYGSAIPQPKSKTPLLDAYNPQPSPGVGGAEALKILARDQARARGPARMDPEVMMVPNPWNESEFMEEPTGLMRP